MQLDPQVIRRHHGEALGPLDDHDATRIAERLVEAELDELRLALEAIQIGVPDDQSARIPMDERERRAVCVAATERCDEARSERGLAGTELADQRDRVTAAHERREPGAGGLGGRGVDENHASSAASLSSQ